MKRRRLIWQLYPLNLAVLLISLAGVSVITVRLFQAHTLRQRATFLEQSAQVLLEKLPPRQDPEFKQKTAALCQSFGEYSFLRFSVLLPDGEIIGDSDGEIGIDENDLLEPEIDQALEGRQVVLRRGDRDGEDRALFVVLPLVENGEVQALVRARMPLGPGSGGRVRPRLWVDLALGACAIALLAAILSYLASRRVSRPVERMKQGALRLAQGELQARLDVPQAEELASLAETLNQMAEHLQRTDQVRRDFVANVSHELRTPITSIVGFAETLSRRKQKSPEETQRFLDIIHKDAQRLTTIVDDLLTLARVEAEQGSVSAVLEKSAVKPVLESAIAGCTAQASERNVTLQLSAQADLAAPIHPRLLEQAVVNLLQNAIKYSEPHQRVEVEAKPSGSHIEISVRDHGCGIAAEHLPRLFERFYRVDKSRSRKQGGTGLGLAIVKHIATVHRGDVAVVTAPGEGSVFSLQIPSA